MFNKNLLLIAAAWLALVLPVGGLFAEPARAQFNPAISIQREPHLVVDRDNRLLLVMAAGTPGRDGRPGSQILFTQSTDGGTSWDNMPLTRNLSNSRINGLGALFPRIAVSRTSPTRAYVVYDDDTGGPRQAYFVRSKKNFKRAAILSSGNDGGFVPVVDVDSTGAANIAWGRSERGSRQVVLVRSTDQGMTFSQPLDVSRSGGEGFDPAIAIGYDDAINLAWEDTGSGKGELFFSRSIDGGASFSGPRKLSAGAGQASDAAIAIDRQGRISVAWVEEQPAGGTRIMISQTMDGGRVFTSPLVVAAGPEAEFEYIAMAAGRNAIYLAFTDDDAQQVFLTRSTSDSLRFSPPLQLSHADASRGHAKSPSIAVDDNGRIHAVWIDTSIIGNESGLVVYRSSADGQSFNAPTLILAVVQ